MSTTNRLYTFKEILTDGIYVKEEEGEIQKKVSQILIPMIQRPYAQGRRSQESIRLKFLTDIFYAICNSSVDKLELNFIYGTFICHDGDRNVFELLDGQQRMTTLFLLHWYIANQDRAQNEGFVFPDYLNKFEYQTRTTSTDFLAKLIVSKIQPNQNPAISIRRSAWYSKSFDKDTTIDAMIRMLGSIHTFYTKAEVKPHYSDLDKLQFYVLELDGFGLTEELFIKMNARGLQLTPFENFKADLIGYMKKEDRYCKEVNSAPSKMGRSVAYWLDFSSLMDGRWGDLFWQPSEEYNDSDSKECDIRFFRFVQRFFANKAILIARKSNHTKMKDDKFVRFFIGNIEIERHFGFDIYEDFIQKCFGSNIDLIEELSHLLNMLTDKTIGGNILAELTAPWEDERLWQPWGTEGRTASDVGQRQMIILSAMTEFLGCIKDTADFRLDDYKAWMHFVHAIVQGTDITRIDNQITLTRMLKEILCQDGFDAHKEPYKAIVTYNTSHRDNRYLAAEAVKAEQILDNPEWREVFAEAEKDKFMQGSCSFYFEKGIDIETYKKRTSRVGLLFNENGVTTEFATEFYLLRAVMCRNYDWSSFRKGQYNFNITNSSTNRFLRNLTIWNDNAEVKDLFCHLLDKEGGQQMKDYIQKVIEEDHKLILKEGVWADSAIEELNLSYKRSFKEQEMKPLKWLYELCESSMGFYINNLGQCCIYKGHVNSMYLGFSRHRYIPKITEAFKDKFGFDYEDRRQLDNLRKYGNFTGTDICLVSTDVISPNSVRVRAEFHHDGSLSLLITSESIARKLYNVFTKQYGETAARTIDGMDIKTPDGAIGNRYENGVKFFRICNIDNFDSLPEDEILDVFQKVYDYSATL